MCTIVHTMPKKYHSMPVYLYFCTLLFIWSSILSKLQNTEYVILLYFVLSQQFLNHQYKTYNFVAPKTETISELNKCTTLDSLARQICDMYKSVVETSKNVSYTKNIFAFLDLWTKGHLFFLLYNLAFSRCHSETEKKISVLQIRRGKMDNSGIIFHITPLKHVVIHHQSHHTEMVLMRGHNIYFCWEIKIIFELSSIPPLIKSSEQWHTDSLNKHLLFNKTGI